MTIDTVLFDLDGTLTDSAPGIVAGVRHALAAVGEPEPPPEWMRSVVGPPMTDSLRGLRMSEDRVERAMAAYRQRYDERGWAENSVFDGIEAVLVRLHEAGVPMAVATSKNENSARRILEHFGLAQYFRVIAGASDDGTRRAKSDVVARALAGLGRDTHRTDGVVMVGDRIHDVEGAGVFGIPVVLVRWGYGSHEEHERARWSVGTTDELTTLLSSSTADVVDSGELR